MDRQQIQVEPGSKKWEEICKRCGRCCYEKLDYRGQIFYTTKPCPHLDTEIKQCRIYPQRSELHPECARLTPEIAASGFLPEDCPYVVGSDNYQAPEIDED